VFTAHSNCIVLSKLLSDG